MPPPSVPVVNTIVLLPLMPEDTPRIQLLTMDIDEALSSVKGLQERIRALEATTCDDCAKFLAFRTWSEQTLGRKTRTHERCALASIITYIFSVKIGLCP